MSDLIRANLWRRMRYTPLRDWIRGRLNVRLDWRGQLTESNLPVAARELIGRVTARTRLWRLEKADVANELMAHFLDALAAEMPMETIVRSFGDERQAAKLIRRSKKRNRPLAWHLFVWLGRSVAVLVVIYIALAGQVFLTHPSPRTDYLAEINSRALSAPETERAWPIYRRAILTILSGGQEKIPDWVGHDVDGNHWPDAEAWLRTHQADLEALRQARSKSTLGFVLGSQGSVHDKELYPNLVGEGSNPSSESRLPGLASVLLPYLNDLRVFALILQADGKLALLDKDSDRLENDIVALHRMAAQLRDNDEFLVTQLVALGIDEVSLDTLDRALSTQPGVLRDDQLIRLAHSFSQAQIASDLIDVRGERMIYHDFVQRVFTDDGHGDGHVTAQGLRLLGLYMQMNRAAVNWTPWEIAATPAIAALAPSRKEIISEYDRLSEMTEADLHLPARNVDRRPAEEIIAELRRRWGPVAPYFLQLITTTSRAGETCERFLGKRDGVVTGIALEIYQRRNGAYPQTLDALAPTYLPVIPADRITGEPIKYRLIDGHPLLYSVGVDRIDDGGVPPKNNPYGAADWSMSADEARNGSIRGDWILFPQPKMPQQDDN